MGLLDYKNAIAHKSIYAQQNMKITQRNFFHIQAQPEVSYSHAHPLELLSFELFYDKKKLFLFFSMPLHSFLRKPKCCRRLLSMTMKKQTISLDFHLANSINTTAKTNFLQPKLSEALEYITPTLVV